MLPVNQGAVVEFAKIWQVGYSVAETFFGVCWHRDTETRDKAAQGGATQFQQDSLGSAAKATTIVFSNSSLSNSIVTCRLQICSETQQVVNLREPTLTVRRQLPPVLVQVAEDKTNFAVDGVEIVELGDADGLAFC